MDFKSDDALRSALGKADRSLAKNMVKVLLFIAKYGAAVALGMYLRGLL